MSIRDIEVDGVMHRVLTPEPISRSQAVVLVRMVENYHAQADEPAARRLTRAQQRAVLNEQDAVYWAALSERYEPKTVATERKAA